eukprot:TRINITY_DN67095_c0_g1_i1.p1 TRINITY_DN67095_c0_g1~~TRINITY_DN67095_c0_g1_i1.p1  ORF type:complete len:463 (-),score=74.98 TRINITY_DN67095_c0_g1_i1:164-1495(-)
MAISIGPDDARNRYASSFTSRIFEPQCQAKSRGVPAGKRRDQTTSEMFGEFNDKDLRAMPKTFEPCDDNITPRQKKLAFLSSEVLPRTAHARCNGGGYGGNSSYAPRKDCYMSADTDEVIDPRMRRQEESSSGLFGRETPAATHDQVHDNSKRLTPTDFKWFSIPEKVPSSGENQGVAHFDRHYNEKRSNMLAYSTPPSHHAGGGRFVDDRETQELENEGDQKRRVNVYYSDLFGRKTPMELPEQQVDAFGDQSQRFHPKKHGSPEDRITVHQDWTDSKTEIVCGSRGPKATTPISRKTNELHQARIFGSERRYEDHSNIDAANYDNSEKVKGVIGCHTQQIHQAHLRSSMTLDEFYEEANSTTHWEVVELHISGLSVQADEALVRSFCTGFDLQIVKVGVDVDPVRNLCKGRAKIMVRYNPKKDTISGLVRKLEEARLRVEI